MCVDDFVTEAGLPDTQAFNMGVSIPLFPLGLTIAASNIIFRLVSLVSVSWALSAPGLFCQLLVVARST